MSGARSHIARLSLPKSHQSDRHDDLSDHSGPARMDGRVESKEAEEIVQPIAHEAELHFLSVLRVSGG